ncbi:MAG: Stp1/IreP family PP2C-type Ser/Thr phosphatase [bacterium]|nr:Stp1/IreP family PP2C-type Ser/Thr phosphatase [bacterium]
MKSPILAGRTDVGRQRDHNEDAFAVVAKHGIAIVADGMGGHNAGEVASEIAISTTIAILSSTAGLSAHDRLDTAVHAAHASIRDKAAESARYKGMGTTIVAVLLDEKNLSVAHVGDSRLYQLRKGQLRQLTRDHSLLQEFIDKGLYSPAEAKEKVARNIITRALGLEDALKVDISAHPLQSRDRYLLCSDGVHEMLGDAEIAAVLLQGLGAEATCEELIDHANAKGGKDNITVIVIDV